MVNIKQKQNTNAKGKLRHLEAVPSTSYVCKMRPNALCCHEGHKDDDACKTDMHYKQSMNTNSIANNMKSLSLCMT
jgi:hypothetical protein